MTTRCVDEHGAFHHQLLSGIDSAHHTLVREALDSFVRRHQPTRTDDNPAPMCPPCGTTWPCRDVRLIAETLRISAGRVVVPRAPASARRVRDGLTLSYSVPAEAFYASTLPPSDLRCIDVQATHDEGGVGWDFAVYEADYGGSTVGVRLFTDGFQALTDIPDFFDALREEKPDTLVDVRAILDRIGAWDRTARVNPRA